MKIALVVHDFLASVGHGRYCIELARRFSAHHEVHVLANRFEDKLDFAYTPRFVKAWRGKSLFAALTFPGAAQMILDAESFDIVHAQGYACHRADVITAHVCNAARYRRAPAQGAAQKLFPFFVIPKERAFFQRAGAREIIAVSQIAERELQTEYHAANTCVIYHGVDTKTFSPATPERHRKLREQMLLPQDRWLWLFVGEAAKGLRPAIEALDQFPEAHLVVVTRSPLHPWRVFAQQQALSQRIAFQGPTSTTERYYQASDLFLYPSDYDTFGMVVAEAMGCGLPVIVGKNIGAAEWIEPGQNGFLCDPNQPHDIHAQIRAAETLRGQPVLEAATATARSHTWDHCAAETMEAYERAIISKRQK
jgi:UDP-glucose:(heptosyl)LPS alpha-1,3-glucosyltransferase